jgi:hypothetical protein
MDYGEKVQLMCDEVLSLRVNYPRFFGSGFGTQTFVARWLFF